VAAVFKGLRDLGVRLSVDDFGTGYSSLSYLHRLPLDTLKVDRSFVHQIGDGNENMEIVRAIVSMAHSLKMDVVAEGVENAEQMAALQTLGCALAQGFYFSRPVNISACDSLIAEQPWTGGALVKVHRA
jgi:EAL domain-containing protein (putative c-di-GMP-specific phosphodiesterase class I)